VVAENNSQARLVTTPLGDIDRRVREVKRLQELEVAIVLGGDSGSLGEGRRCGRGNHGVKSGLGERAALEGSERGRRSRGRGQARREPGGEGGEGAVVGSERRTER